VFLLHVKPFARREVHIMSVFNACSEMVLLVLMRLLTGGMSDKAEYRLGNIIIAILSMYFSVHIFIAVRAQFKMLKLECFGANQSPVNDDFNADKRSYSFGEMVQ